MHVNLSRTTLKPIIPLSSQQRSFLPYRPEHLSYGHGTVSQLSATGAKPPFTEVTFGTTALQNRKATLEALRKSYDEDITGWIVMRSFLALRGEVSPAQEEAYKRAKEHYDQRLSRYEERFWLLKKLTRAPKEPQYPEPEVPVLDIVLDIADPPLRQLPDQDPDYRITPKVKSVYKALQGLYNVGLIDEYILMPYILSSFSLKTLKLTEKGRQIAKEGLVDRLYWNPDNQNH